MIEQLAQGLAAVHDKKLVHRDIKPGNVIVFDRDIPALADFGIVHDPEAERITTRPAGNRFARDLASLYDPTLAPTEGDCLCLANLWAWMLASAPQLQHGNYHWRFHRFVEDERCDIARAILAMCSEPSVCPKDGRAFAELLTKRFSLRQLTTPSAGQEGAPSVRAYTAAVAEAETSKVALRSEIEVLALAVLPQLQPLVATLRESARHLASQNLPAKLHVVGLSDPLAHEDVVRAMLSSENSRLSHQLAYLTCGDDSTMDFSLQLSIEWHKHPHEDRSKFSIHIRFVHEASAQIDQVNSRYYKIQPGGDVEHFDAAGEVARIQEFFQDPNMWRTRTGPRNRPGGSYWG